MAARLRKGAARMLPRVGAELLAERGRGPPLRLRTDPLAKAFALELTETLERSRSSKRRDGASWHQHGA